MRQVVKTKAWLGKVVAELAKSDHIQAAVLLHPAMVTVDDIKGTCPMFLCLKKKCKKIELHTPVIH